MPPAKPGAVPHCRARIRFLPAGAPPPYDGGAAPPLVRALQELKARGALLRFTKRREEIGDLEMLKKLARS